MVRVGDGTVVQTCWVLEDQMVTQVAWMEWSEESVDQA
jgi:hypothetical protein